MQVGLVGLGKMGAGMARRLVAGGHDVVGMDISEAARQQAADVGATTVATLDQLVAALSGSRTVWVMLPPGDLTRACIAELADLLNADDLVIDGGNSDFRDAHANREVLTQRGIHFADVGVSGGQWGWKNGYGIMVGAQVADYERITTVLDSLSANGGFHRVGDVGSGHLVKAIHNGVQYAIMQAYAEGYSILDAHPEVDNLAALAAWQQGGSIRSWLLEQILEALHDTPDLSAVSSQVSDSGMGRWTAEEAVRLGVPTPVLTTALYARFASRSDGISNKVLVAARGQVGGQKS